MKRYFLAAIMAASVAMTGCSDEFDDGGYSDVYEGVVIYNEAMISRVFATDGASMAMRLAILMEELDAKGLSFTSGSSIEPDYTQLPVYTSNGTDFDRRELLIGDTDEVTITRDENIYTVTYYNPSFTTKHISADFDFCRRKGGFEIDTNGIDLIDTSSSTPWTITFAGEDGESAVMTYATSYTYEYGGDVEAMATSCKIYKDQNTNGRFIVEGSINACYMSYSDYYPFKVTGYITLGDFVDGYTDLTVENTIGVSSTVYLTTSSSDSHDTISGLAVQYTTTTPLVYSPTNFGVYSISGVEWAKYDSAASAGYASNTVTVTSNADASRIINYNGHSYTWSITGASW
ncbi:MAG: hypothetical protein SNG35_00220 [Rikenellaceae bacterium]